MQSFEIEIEPREGHGSRESRRTRRDGFLPAVVYARGEASVSARVPTQAFLHLGSSSRSSQVFQFKSGNPTLHGRSAIVKGIQKNHLDGTVLHVDFQALRDNEDISVPVVLHFEGEAPGVKLDGGILAIARHEIVLTCLPRLIPQDVKVDVSSLQIGQSIHARELKLPDGVRLHGNPDETIVSVVLVRQAVEAEASAPTAEGAAATAAAAGAEGAAAAPAAGADAKAGGDKKPAADKKPADKK